ncbi:MAG: nicotinate-nicotinamide nucleotide adenylyltransferase [Armatimonadota bacterium]
MVGLHFIFAELKNSPQPKLGFVKRAEVGIVQGGQKLGVFSGSFNPPTIAHVRICEHAQKHLQLNEVLLLLAIVNVDKTQFDFSLEERVEMMTALAGEHPNWSAALCSHGRFVEKAKAVSSAYPEGTEIWFIVGYDTLVRIFEPRFYRDMPMRDALQQFFELANLAVFPRSDAAEEVVKEFLERPEVKPFSSRVTVLPSEPSLLWVSSTLVREKLKSGEPVDELVPRTVLKFLKLPLC